MIYRLWCYRIVWDLTFHSRQNLARYVEAQLQKKCLFRSVFFKSDVVSVANHHHNLLIRNASKSYSSIVLNTRTSNILKVSSLYFKNVVDCLATYIKENKDSDSTSQQCKHAVRIRQIVADRDIRLNPRLTKNCRDDIPQ